MTKNPAWGNLECSFLFGYSLRIKLKLLMVKLLKHLVLLPQLINLGLEVVELFLPLFAGKEDLYHVLVECDNLLNDKMFESMTVHRRVRQQRQFQLAADCSPNSDIKKIEPFTTSSLLARSERQCVIDS